MHRFFVPEECIQGNRIMISGRQAHRLREVLRLEVGARIVVLDGGGLEYLVELLDITSGRVTTEVVKCYHCSNEPRIPITLYQALLKGSGFDLILQKCTEIDVVEMAFDKTQRVLPGGFRGRIPLTILTLDIH